MLSNTALYLCHQNIPCSSQAPNHRNRMKHIYTVLLDPYVSGRDSKLLYEYRNLVKMKNKLKRVETLNNILL